MEILRTPTPASRNDHYGSMDMPRDPVTLQRAFGVALVAVGAVVMRV